MSLAPLILIIGILFWSTLAFLAARQTMRDSQKPLRRWVQPLGWGLWLVLGIAVSIALACSSMQMQIFQNPDPFTALPMVIALFSSMIAAAALACILER
ncbi:MAG: hypothetical protein F6J87_27025 [Spirulina sp. SIO3F2]|nr:hypothetical protein [Spirulina sp. SIO3F2]